MPPHVQLTDLARSALSVLLSRGEATRRVLASEMHVSFASVTYVMKELIAAGLAHELRRDQGPRGRSALVYEVPNEAGWTLAIDIGKTQVSMTARALNGAPLSESVRPLKQGEAWELAGTLARSLLTGMATQPCAVAVAVNRVVPRTLGEDSGPLDALVAALARTAGLDPSTPVLVENNVNCAAVAEHELGEMQGCDDAVYMQAGVGIGLGIFTNGALLRGAGGASGEVAGLPMSWTGSRGEAADAIERRYGADGILAEATRACPHGTELHGVEDVFGAAGERWARSIMARHARALARIAIAATTVLDPSVLVIGGGLIQDETFAGMIAREFTARPTRTRLRTSRLGRDASVTGASLLARDLALTHLLGQHHIPLLSKPAIWVTESAREEDRS
jgi:predicted NBD/HSP70 family sugar kinase